MNTIIGVIFLVFVIVFSLQQIEKDRVSFMGSVNGVETSFSAENEIKINVTITGCVKNEGKYVISSGDFLEDVISKAGGLTDDADYSCFQLYLIIEEDIEIYIPKVTDDEKISINYATEEELDKLPGIGSTLANRIINYRDEKGEFSYLEELLKIDGIGKTLFKNIKDKICL